MFAYRPEMLRYRVVDTESKLADLRDKLMQVSEFAFDTETNTLKVLSDDKDFSLVGISISWGHANNYYIPVGHRRYEDIERNISVDLIWNYLKRPFERTDVRIIGHNLKFDLHVLARIGIVIRTTDIFDTMVASWLCDENSRNGLKENSGYFLGIEQTHFAEVTANVSKEIKKEFGLKANNKATFDLVLIDEGAPYALDDAFYTWWLYIGFTSKLEDEEMDKIFYKVYMPFLLTLFKMEERGVTVDVDRLEQMRIDITKDMDDLEYQMFEIAGVKFNPSSSQQLGTLLFGYVKKELEIAPWDSSSPMYNDYMRQDERGRNKIRRNYEKTLDKHMTEVQPLIDNSFNFRILSKTPTGAPQVNDDALWNLSHMSFKTKKKQEGVELCKLLLKYKKLSKLRSAFIEGLQEQLYDDGKAHPSFNIIGTDSGRLSCSSPNLQQLPKAEEDDKYQIRSLFIGSKYVVDEEGHYLCDLDEFTGELSPDRIKRKKIVAIDFANLEMRVLAHFSEDKNLLKMFADGADTHGSTAVNMFELPCEPGEVKKKYPHLRQAAKIINFLKAV